MAFADHPDTSDRSEELRIPGRVRPLGTLSKDQPSAPPTQAAAALEPRVSGRRGKEGGEGVAPPSGFQFNLWNRPLAPRRDSTGSRKKLEKAYAPVAILDQEDPDPDFSVRFPSLLSSGPVRRSHTIGGYTDVTTSMSRNINPESEIARYPTMQQFEQGRHHPDPVLAAETQKKDKENPQIVPGAWPSEQPRQESSGEFFKRMTGLDQPDKNMSNLHRSNTVTAADPAARLPGPWDPLADLANTTSYPRQQDESLRRSNTERGPHRHLRRPYSERFSGAGRMPWESFLPPRPADTAHADAVLQNRLTEAANPSLRRLRHRHALQRQSLTPLIIPTPTLRHSASMRNPMQVPLNSQRRAQPQVQQAAQPKTKVETCISHLRNLGYAAQVRGGVERLRIYAEATGGDLGDTIEMIEEERKVYEGGIFP